MARPPCDGDAPTTLAASDMKLGLFCDYSNSFTNLSQSISKISVGIRLAAVRSGVYRIIALDLPCIMQVRDGSPNACNRHISTQEGFDGPRMDGRVWHGPEQVEDALRLGGG